MGANNNAEENDKDRGETALVDTGETPVQLMGKMPMLLIWNDR